MKLNKIIYWILTILLSAWMLIQGITFLVNFELTAEFFESVYVSPLLVAPLGVAKILAVIAIITGQSNLLKKLAYLGLGIDFLSAIAVHLNAGDGGYPAPVLALVLLIASFVYYRKLDVSLIHMNVH